LRHRAHVVLTSCSRRAKPRFVPIRRPCAKPRDRRRHSEAETGNPQRADGAGLRERWRGEGRYRLGIRLPRRCDLSASAFESRSKARRQCIGRPLEFLPLFRVGLKIFFNPGLIREVVRDGAVYVFEGCQCREILKDVFRRSPLPKFQNDGDQGDPRSLNV
jgi:hypothetical protein